MLFFLLDHTLSKKNGSESFRTFNCLNLPFQYFQADALNGYAIDWIFVPPKIPHEDLTTNMMIFGDDMFRE